MDITDIDLFDQNMIIACSRGGLIVVTLGSDVHRNLWY